MLSVEDRFKKLRKKCNNYIDCYHCKLTKMNDDIVPSCTMLLCQFEQAIKFEGYKLNQDDIDCINMYYNAMFNDGALFSQPKCCLICNSFGVTCDFDSECIFKKCDKFELYIDSAYKAMNT